MTYVFEMKITPWSDS